MDKSLRLFYAIELSEEALQEIAEIREILRAQNWTQFTRWIPLENLHITVRFIGSCHMDHVVELGHKVKDAIKDIPAFSLTLGAVKLFPTPSHPHVLSITIQPCPPLFQLADAIEQSVVAAGFPPEHRSYLPHLSIARFSRRPKLVPEHLPSLQSTFAVNEIVLLNSQQERDKRVYEPLQRIILSAI